MLSGGAEVGSQPVCGVDWKKVNQYWPPLLFQVARSHPWTPMKMETTEQSNLGSKPRKPAGGAADPWAMVRCT